MIELDNEKISGLRAQWAHFCGFSFLFDAPGGHHRAVGDIDVLGIRNFDSPDLTLYKQLKAVAEQLQPEFQKMLFCAMPASTYHVTVFDGINAANQQQLSDKAALAINPWLAGLPQSTLDLPQALAPLLSSDVAVKSWPIRFQFKRFRYLNHKVIVCDLEAADQASQQNLDLLTSARNDLYDLLEAQTGVAAHTPYEPHVTLGYFASTDGGKAAAPLVPGWEAQVREALTGQTLNVERARLYSFTDMVRFHPFALA